jgi:hypothetical protein
MEDSAASQEGGVVGEEGGMGSPHRRTEVFPALDTVRISTGGGEKALYLLVLALYLLVADQISVSIHRIPR